MNRFATMLRAAAATLLAMPLLALLLPAPGASAKTADRWALVTAAGRIGTLAATTDGARVEIDWRVDDNGRGPKIRERVDLAPGGRPVRWTIRGKGWAGAPVDESFEAVPGHARWRSLDDSGAVPLPKLADVPLYLANNGSPWAIGVVAREALASPGGKVAVLPGGEVRAEKVRDVPLGDGPDAPVATLVAVWGLDLAPQLVLLHADGRLAGTLWPGWVLIDETHAGRYEALSKLAADVGADLLRTLGARLARRFDDPVCVANVRVFDPVSGGLSAPANVVVFGDRIVSVRDGAPPEDAVVIDGAGGTLLPGLHDLHAHASDWGGLLHLAAGVTSTRDPGNDNDVLLALVRRVEAGEVPGPRIERSGFIEGKSAFSVHLGFVADRLEDGLAAVRWYADRGYRAIKLYNSIRPEWVAPIADSAHRLGLRVHGHVPAFMTSDQALLDGYDEIAHINQLVLSWVIGPGDDTRTPFRFTALGERLGKVDLASERVRRTVAIMKERGATLDPTIAIFQSMLLGRPGRVAPNDAPWLDHVPVPVQRGRRTTWLDVKPSQYAAYDASWQRLKEVLALLHREGIRLVPGTDDAAGFVLHSELAAWVEAGIPPADVLRAATIGAARYLGTDALLGTIEAGKLADFVLVDGDPVRDISAIRKTRLVAKGGTVYFPEEIHAALGVRPFATRPDVRLPGGRGR
ncbi:MAG: amidohydrolase family protein [Deltaproteobacteria bacterium]|nr:amidohydrolase family protein [Deltaproteobacteria bacterium]